MISIALSQNGSSIYDGSSTLSSPASSVLAALTVSASAANNGDALVIYDTDSGGSLPEHTPLSSTTITGPQSSSPGINITFGNSNAFSGGVTLDGSSSTGNTYNVLSTYSSEPLSVVAGASTGNIINVGSNPGTPASSTLAGIHSVVSVSGPSGSATLNILDAGDTASAAATVGSSTVSGLGFGSGARSRTPLVPLRASPPSMSMAEQVAARA